MSFRSSGGRGRRLALRLLLLTFTLTAAGAVLLYPWDGPPPLREIDSAGRSIASAAEAGSETLAPDEIEAARRALAQAGREITRQRDRPPLLRRYGEARILAAQASLHAARATREAGQVTQNARALAVASIGDAERAWGEAQEVADVIPLTAGGRRALTQATVALHRARSELRRGDSESSARSARDSASSSRTVLSVAGRLVARLTDDEAIEDWQRWVAETVSWSARHGSSAIVVDKASRRLLYYDRGRLLREFHADLGRNPISDKLREGDNATPEGRYRVSQVKGPGQSRYYRAFLIDYPNANDRKAFERARRSGVIPRNSQIGGLIEIHGHGGRKEDWTNGCVAVTDEVMDFLAQKVVLGTPVTIVGALRHPPFPTALKAGMGTSGGRP